MPKAFRCNTEEAGLSASVIGPDGRFVLEDVTPEAGETYSKGIKRERIYGKVTVEKRLMQGCSECAKSYHRLLQLSSLVSSIGSLALTASLLSGSLS